MDCSSNYIYSPEYISYFIKYNNDINSVNALINPECVDVINSRFLVAYKKAPPIDKPEEFFSYGYEILPKVYGLMDVPAVEEVGAYALRNLPGLMLSGQNVLVGFVDTGIDYDNPIFLDNQGKTRIQYIWDQNEESYGVGTPIFGYGGEFSSEDINAALQENNRDDLNQQGIPYIPGDNDGHGTFLASVVAGREELENNFTGVAPDASIIMVKLKTASDSLRKFYYVEEETSCYSETDIAQGIRYLINKAIELGRPMVICLGVGSNQGDHSGNTNLELYISALSGLRGICFVAPGGNELGGRHHYSGAALQKNIQLTDSGNQIMEINVQEGVDGFTMELWGNAPGLIRVTVQSPSGETMDDLEPDESGYVVEEFAFEGSSLFVYNTVVDSVSGDQVYFFRFDKPAQGIWRVKAQETINQLGGGFNAWLPNTEFVGDKVTFVKSSPDITVTSPGNTIGCITATAYDVINGAIYVDAGRGFTKNGLVKPDLAAPGVDVMGVFAGGSEILYTMRSGTSIAAAYVAGVAALILEWGIIKRNNISINTQMIKQMLIRGANRENGDSYPNNIWGWGKVDALEAFEIVR